MKKLFIISSLFVSSILLAEQHEHKHSSLSAHVHGAVQLAMALEENSIEIELDGPSESFLGFEHKPHSPKESEAFLKAKDLWTKELLTKLFVFPNTLNCKTETTNFEQAFEKSASPKNTDNHSEIEAKAKIICAGNSFKGTEVKIALKKYFPKIKIMKLEIIGQETTKSVELKKVEEIIRLQ